MTKWHPVIYMVVSGMILGGILAFLYLLLLLPLLGGFVIFAMIYAIPIGIGAGAIMGLVEGFVMARLLNGNRLNDVRSLYLINGIITTIVGIIIATIFLGNYAATGDFFGQLMIVYAPILIAIGASVWSTRRYALRNQDKPKRKQKPVG